MYKFQLFSTGLCKTCGGINTIFGTWSFVHPAKECRELQMSIETKRDIFRREMMFIKKSQMLDKMKNETTKELSNRDISKTSEQDYQTNHDNNSNDEFNYFEEN